MKTVEERKRDRFLFLKTIYEACDGNTSRYGDFRKIGLQMGFEEEYFGSAIYDYLKVEGLIRPMGAGYQAAITHKGVLEVDQALSSPNSSTEHFLPVNLTINNISNNSNSLIQTGDGNHASLKVYSQQEKGPYETVLPLLHQFLKELDGERELRAELEAETKSLEAQLKSPKPKFLQEIGKSIRSILEGVAVQAVSASPVYAELIRILPH